MADVKKAGALLRQFAMKIACAASLAMSPAMASAQTAAPADARATTPTAATAADSLPVLSFKGERGVLRPLQQAVADSGLHRVSTALMVEYAGDGHVRSLDLIRSTGNKSLDKAILRWGRALEFETTPGVGGKGVLPISMTVN